MTVIDERSRVPTLDAAALARLAAALELPGVVAAFLFGSQARGSADRLSDVDVAILHDPGLDPRERFRLRLDLADAAGEALGTDEVDLVLVNDAPPLFRERALRDASDLSGSVGSSPDRGAPAAQHQLAIRSAL